MNLKSDARALCPERTGCSDESIALQDDAKANALVSTIAIGSGLALIGTGVVLFVTGRSATDTRAMVTPFVAERSAGASLRIAF